jgi:uncharacterized protein (TIGR02246 family)
MQTPDHDPIESALSQLGRMLFDRDAAFADQFLADAVLVGSEAGEVARGREAIRALLARFHDLPDRYTWDWQRIDVETAGAVAWLFAEGSVVASGARGRLARPYRLSGVLERHDGVWRWRLFHGSEPKT